MKKFYAKVIQYRYIIMAIFLIATIICAICRQYISVDYDMNDYLPSSSSSTIALEVMDEEFEGAIPNARVMMKASGKKEALENKEKLEAVDGVISVTWLDDATYIDLPLEMYNEDTLNTYYKDGYALYKVTIDEEKQNETVPLLYDIIGEDGAMSGSAVSTALATTSTVSQIKKIAIIAVAFLSVILLLTTTSWLEPLVILCGLGIAVLINSGSNLIFGEISFVTNAAGNILQLAVSLDYSVFLIHRFEECLHNNGNDPKVAMIDALSLSTSSILSSGLTTVIGFLALIMMQFRIGPDLGLALAKGIVISLLTVFLFMPGLILITYKWMEKTAHKSFMPSFHKLGKGIKKITFPLGIVFLILIIPAYFASNHNSYYYGSSHIFGSDTRLGQDTEKIESVFGKNDTYVLMVPKGDKVTESAMLDELENVDHVTSITSIVEMIGTTIPEEILPDQLLNQLQSEHYDRIVLSVSADYEGEDTFSLVKKIRGIAEEYYPDTWYLAGQGVSTYDLMDTVTSDMVKVNLIAIVAVFVVLVITMHSIIKPIILVLTIETSIWINFSIPYLTGSSVFYIAYLIVSSIQLGATVDYAILFSDRYKSNRLLMGPKESIEETVSNVTVSILTSGLTMTVIGFLLGVITTHQLLSQLGYFLGKGTICSMIAVLFVLPGYLYIEDHFFNKSK